MPVALVIIGLVAAMILVLVWIVRRRRALSSVQRRELEAKWTHMLALPDAGRRVLEADSILSRALRMLGYAGSMGEQLKAAGPRFRNLDGLWTAHKFRNRIAHEPGTAVNEREAERAVKAFRRGIDDLC